MHVRAHRSQSYIVVSKLRRQRGDPKVGSGSRPDSDDVNRAAHAVTPYPGYHFPGLPVVGPSATPRAPLLPQSWWGTRRSAGLAADAKPEQQFNRPSIAKPQTFQSKDHPKTKTAGSLNTAEPATIQLQNIDKMASGQQSIATYVSLHSDTYKAPPIRGWQAKLTARSQGLRP